MSQTIHVLNGPTKTLGPTQTLFGACEPAPGGQATLAEVERLCRDSAAAHGLAVECRQSTHEGELVDWIHDAGADLAVGLVITPGDDGYASPAMRDAVRATQLPVIEVHMTNIHARESFRHHSNLSAAAKAVICGFGVESYALAIAGLAALAKTKKA